MSTSLHDAVRAKFEKYTGAVELLDSLLQIGDVFAIGGLCREYKGDEQLLNLRDADFAIDVRRRDLWESLISSRKVHFNRFGGYKFDCNNFHIDVWEVNSTWGIQNGYVKVVGHNYIDALARSVYLNLDGIVCNLNSGEWADDLYTQALASKELDVVLEFNPAVNLNILRAISLKLQYNLNYSERLSSIIAKEYHKYPDFGYVLHWIEKERNPTYYISRDTLRSELRSIVQFVEGGN